MEELECVRLIKPFEDLKVGTIDTIVLKYWTPKDGFIK